MRRTIAIVSLALTLSGLTACSAESKAKESLEKYEQVFEMCKNMTDKAKLEPGAHRCSKVSSMAIEMSLKDSGLEEAKWKGMLEAWLVSTGYKPYYLGPDQDRKD